MLNFRGVVDLVRWKAVHNERDKGCVIFIFVNIDLLMLLRSEGVHETDEITPELFKLAKKKRSDLIEAIGLE